MSNELLQALRDLAASLSAESDGSMGDGDYALGHEAGSQSAGEALSDLLDQHGLGR